jgi:hypothetical protein
MKNYAILTNRKRSIIALVHSVVFASIAFGSILRTAQVSPIWLRSSSLSAAAITVAIYVVVSSVLIALLSVSRCAIERLYFAFCASSASVGLIRNVIGDQNLPVGQYFRLVMLLCAVLTGVIILCHHSQVLATAETE